MKSFMQGVKRFATEEDGVTMIEYGLLAALIAVVSITAITLVGTTLETMWGTISDALAPAA